jgi:hypothetical protein
MNAYVDHNFLINCITIDGWRAITTDACNSGRVRLIVSPWNIFEIGKSRDLHVDELLTIVDEFKPSWILERVDLQLREFVVAWNNFWNGRRSNFDPIQTLAEVHASFFRCRIELVENYTLRDYATIWKRPEASHEADVEFRKQAEINALNHISYANGRLTSRVIQKIRERYIARQFAIARNVGLSHHLIYQYENMILNENKLRTFIWFFVEYGGMDGMLAHQVEESLTFNQWETDAKLNKNRLLDRFHATAALPYCDLFVTSDIELIKKSQAIRDKLRFKIAIPVTGEDFIEWLRNTSDRDHAQIE